MNKLTTTQLNLIIQISNFPTNQKLNSSPMDKQECDEQFSSLIIQLVETLGSLTLLDQVLELWPQQNLWYLLLFFSKQEDIEYFVAALLQRNQYNQLEPKHCQTLFKRNRPIFDLIVQKKFHKMLFPYAINFPYSCAIIQKELAEGTFHFHALQTINLPEVWLDFEERTPEPIMYQDDTYFDALDSYLDKKDEYGFYIQDKSSFKEIDHQYEDLRSHYRLFVALFPKIAKKIGFIIPSYQEDPRFIYNINVSNSPEFYLDPKNYSCTEEQLRENTKRLEEHRYKYNSPPGHYSHRKSMEYDYKKNKKLILQKLAIFKQYGFVQGHQDLIDDRDISNSLSSDEEKKFKKPGEEYSLKNILQLLEERERENENENSDF